MKRQALLLLAVGALFGAPAQAALYRCGNVFQDRPCDGSAPVAHAPAKAVEAAPAPAASATSSAAATTPNPARDAGSAACSALRDQRTDIETRMRAGGSAGSMEVLQNQRRDVEARLRRAEC